jgi:hypothetical protein
MIVKNCALISTFISCKQLAVTFCVSNDIDELSTIKRMKNVKCFLNAKDF